MKDGAGRTAQVVIVGSGPAGVSAAWPLVQAGIDVLMLDAGGAPVPSSPEGTIGALRRSAGRPGVCFGDDPPQPGRAQDRSPKLATPLARAVSAGFAEALNLEARGFFAVGSLASGGLSTIWGAAVPRFTDAALAHFPCGAEEMREAYARVEARIGVGGGVTALSPPVGRVLARHARCTDGLMLARASNAVLESPRDGRADCNQCGLCLWGCARGCIYNSAYDLPALQRFPNFRHEARRLVRALRPAAQGHVIEIENAAPIAAPCVVLAAGTLATTALVLRRLGAFGHSLRLLSNPVGALAACVPGLFGAALPERSFSLGQLHYSMAPSEGGPDAAGMVYAADTLPLGVIADRLPFSRPLALRFARALAPSLVLATCYLPGEFSDNLVGLENGSGRLVVTGAQPPETRVALRAAGRRLARHLRRRGAYALPGSFTVSEPGSDAHYAGTLPMGADGSFGCAADGALNGALGLYVVDGACLPVLPAQHCTLTIMANADRIGRALARLRGGLTQSRAEE